jgi:hypothetical protein
MTEPQIRVAYPNKRSVLASSRAEGGSLSLFAPTTAAVEVGQRIRIQVTLGDSDRRFDLSGQVTWRRPLSRGMKLEPGLGISFNPQEKWAVAQMLAFCAGRPLRAGTAVDQRVKTSIKCKVAVGRKQVDATVRDLSASGAFVTSKRLSDLPAGTTVTVRLEPGWFGFGGHSLPAKIIWSGPQKGVHGFGARFVGEKSEVRPVLKKYLGPASQ